MSPARIASAPSRPLLQGAYPAMRAAALAGVPRSTVYYWARKGVVTPSISHTKEKLWSYADLIGLRIVHWLRQQKQREADIIKATPMTQVRRALASLSASDVDLWHVAVDGEIASPIVVDRKGAIHLRTEKRISNLDNQSLLGPDFCDLLGPFESGDLTGPHLVLPRPLIRIVPGKLSGEPHVDGTRLSSKALGALQRGGFSLERIHLLYPDVTSEAIAQALDLELQLEANARVAA